MPKGSKLVNYFLAKGRYTFTFTEVKELIGGSADSVRAVLRRLKVKNELAMPTNGFYVILTPEYQHLGCLPPLHFISDLMQYWNKPYYIGLLSAAELHGVAHQRPQITQVITEKNHRAVKCGKVRINFIAKKNTASMPTVSQNTPRGSILVSSQEVTAYDLIGYARHCGGLSHVSDVLNELADLTDMNKLLEITHLYPVPWVQRLGYLLKFLNKNDLIMKLSDWVAKNSKEYTPLSLSNSEVTGMRDVEWRVIINEDVEVES